jgi:hypothetical protein
MYRVLSLPFLHLERWPAGLCATLAAGFIFLEAGKVSNGLESPAVGPRVLLRGQRKWFYSHWIGKDIFSRISPGSQQSCRPGLILIEDYESDKWLSAPYILSILLAQTSHSHFHILSFTQWLCGGHKVSACGWRGTRRPWGHPQIIE